MPENTDKPSYIRMFVHFLCKTVAVFFVLSIVWVVWARFVPVVATPLMYIRGFEHIAHGKLPEIRKNWVSIDNISPNMIQAVISSEDNLFSSHIGFSFDDIQRAMKKNSKGKRIYGGSTISQQTAKNVFLFPQRSYVRKAFEAYFTALIELVWGKKRIMEVYLNVIEMGDEVYGIEAAAQKYFNIPAAKLNREQSALIAACLPNPRKFNAVKPSRYIRNRQQKIMFIMRQLPKPDFLPTENNKK